MGIRLCTIFHGTYWWVSRTVGPFTQGRHSDMVTLGLALKTPPSDRWGLGCRPGRSAAWGAPIFNPEEF
jgi:hypothetical protein